MSDCDVLQKEPERRMKNLAERRKAKGITQAVLAKRLKCSKEYISRIENGRVAPTSVMIARIENILDGGLGMSAKDMYKPRIPFQDEEERAEFHRMWCKRQG